MTVNYGSCFCIMNCVMLSIKSPALWPAQQRLCAYCLRVSHACGITSTCFDWQLHNSFVVANGGCVTFSLLSRFARCTYNCRCQRTRTSQAPSPPRARRRESSWLQVNGKAERHVWDCHVRPLLVFVRNLNIVTSDWSLRMLSRQSFCCGPSCLFAVSVWCESRLGTNWRCNLEYNSACLWANHSKSHNF